MGSAGPSARQGGLDGSDTVTTISQDRVKWQRSVRRRRALAIGVLLLIAGAVAPIAIPAGRSPLHQVRAKAHQSVVKVAGSSHSKGSPAPSQATPGVKRPSAFAVGLRVLRLIDGSRTIRLPDGSTQSRTLLTYVRYPALSAPSRTDVRNAPAARSYGPFPLVIFGHGFAVTPGPYERLLQAWARAGYVVAAPTFPLENAHAPGGPNESDLINEPADMSFVISRMLAASDASSGPLAGLIDPAGIAVSGQSDGGDSALAAAYDSHLRDPRIKAAIILSGAEIPGLAGFAFPPGSPPLLAAQGTADTVNLPSETGVFFDAAHRPKYMLKLLGAEHLPPYTDQEPQLAIVERVTIAFMDGYLKHRSRALRRLAHLGEVPGTATVLAEP